MILGRSVGVHAIGKLCENGVRLGSFACCRDLIASSTYFQQKFSRLVSWRAPNKCRSKNQIDHVLLNGRWRSAVTAIRYRWTKLLHQSDHALVVVRVRAKLKSWPAGVKQRRPDLGRLKQSGYSTRFNIEVSNRFENLPTDGAIGFYLGRMVAM